MLRVYISGPITKGDRIHNFAQAASAQRQLMNYGFATLNPMLSMMHPAADQIDYEKWLAGDLAWIEVADAVLRLPGESVGADRECGFAADNGVPVFHSIGELIDHRAKRPIAI